MAPPSEETIQQALTDACGSDAIDEATCAYMSSIVAEEDPQPDSAAALTELLEPYLEDAGVDAKDVCERLFLKLYPNGASKADTKSAKPAGAGYSSEKQAMKTPIVLGGLLKDDVKADFGDAWNTLGGENKHNIDELPQDQLKVVAAIGKAKKEKVVRRAERKAWRHDGKVEDDSVWVDLPAGTSIAGSGGGVDFHLTRMNLPNKRGAGGDLLCNVSCTFTHGRRYGLIGRNGVGKSTFLDAIARREIKGVPACSIFYVRQEVAGDERTPLEWILQADSEKAALIADRDKLEKEATPAAAARLTEVYARLDELTGTGLHQQEARAMEILNGLGFDDELRAKRTNQLSGGWRMRVAIGCALFVEPGLLLLDEPTNHLDLETVLWLEGYLTRDFNSTLMVVSHDRVFLNEVVTDVVLFEKETLEIIRGDYSTFERVREEHKLRQQRLFEAQQAKRDHLMGYIEKHAQSGNNGCKVAAQRKTRMKKLERLGMESQSAIDGHKMKLSYDGVQDEVAEIEELKSVELDFPDPGICDSLGNPLACFDGCSFAYPGEKELFKNISFAIDQKSKIALMGKNGCGKSTLIKVLLGKLKATGGKCDRHRGAKIEYIAQHHLDELDGESTALQTLLDRYPGDGSNAHDIKMRQFLGQFGFSGEVLPHQTIRTLSGGQKFRVSLALALRKEPHLLIMDEPTNHLDMETIDALIEAINDFKGGVVVVSHDEHLIASCCTELRLLANKKCAVFKGTIADYKKQILGNKK